MIAKFTWNFLNFSSLSSSNPQSLWPRKPIPCLLQNITVCAITFSISRFNFTNSFLLESNCPIIFFLKSLNNFWWSVLMTLLVSNPIWFLDARNFAFGTFLLNKVENFCPYCVKLSKNLFAAEPGYLLHPWNISHFCIILVQKIVKFTRPWRFWCNTSFD